METYYLFKRAEDNVWVFGPNADCEHPSGTCRVTPSTDRTKISIIYISKNESNQSIFDVPFGNFKDEAGVAYASFAALKAGYAGFFFIKLAVSQAEGDERYVQLDDGEPIELYSKSEIDAFNAISLQIKFRNDIFAISGIDYEFPIGTTGLNSTNAAMVDGTRYYITYNIKKARTITGVAFNMATAQANFTGDNENVIVLYSVNKTTGALTELTRTANDPNIWKGATNTKISVNFLAAQALQPGFYAIGLLYNCSGAATTSPTLAVAGSAYSAFYVYANNFKITGQTASQTTMPSSVNMSTFSLASTIWGILLQ